MRLRRRRDEERQLTRADLKYLRALFGRLAQEKKRTASGSTSLAARRTTSFSFAAVCIPEIETAVAETGGLIDASI